MGVSPRISSYHHYFSLSLSLNSTVTMFVLPRLQLLLSIIFLGLFCLLHTVTCQKPCTEDHTPDVNKCQFQDHTIENCWNEKEGITCDYKCIEQENTNENPGNDQMTSNENPDGETTYTSKLDCYKL